MKWLSQLFIVFFIFLSSIASAQSDQCEYWPAPCPHETEISNARDWTVAKNNGRLPQEMLFEEMLKSKAEKIVNDAQAAAKNITLKKERIESELKEFIQAEKELIKRYEES